MDNWYLPSPAVDRQEFSKVIDCNAVTKRYGLTLKPVDVQTLFAVRIQALRRYGRIEFSGGVIRKLVLAFCDSPHISPNEYTEIIGELIDMFYYFKNEIYDALDDDELISLMKACFDGVCEGSIELLRESVLETLARAVRYGETPFFDPYAERFMEDDDE